MTRHPLSISVPPPPPLGSSVPPTPAECFSVLFLLPPSLSYLRPLPTIHIYVYQEYHHHFIITTTHSQYFIEFNAPTKNQILIMSSYTTMDESFTNENEIYYANSNFSNYQMFTEQELYCFLPAEQNIYQNTDGAVYPQFATGYYDNGIVPMQDCYSMGIQDGYMSAEEDAFSCQPSPFLEQQYPRSSFVNNGSPITPSGSPLASEIEYYHNSVPSYMLVPGYQNDQVQEYNSYGVPAAFNSSSVPSLASSISSQDTVLDSPCMSSPALGSPGSDDDEDEEEEYENDLSLLPNQGNKELRGMGLYDSPPDLFYTNCSTPIGCSPVSPHATLGKGLVLERSFGLPDEMMIKDESSGKIIKGKLETEEDDEEPMMYDEEECGEWDGTYQNTFQPQYDISFYSQTNRGW